ncbi:MAG: RDD family protein, partial [Opitutus sp.]
SEPVPAESSGFTGAPGIGAVPPPLSAAAEPAGVPPVTKRSIPVPISAATLHRAGFWIRLAASALDALLVAIAIHLMPRFLQPNFLLVYAAYCVLFWGLKGTTVGGIVCNLKVVRLDDRPVDWATALVRSLAGFLSFFASGIGFIWVAFDDQRQSWHDKIAGTTIVQVPKGVSLV